MRKLRSIGKKGSMILAAGFLFQIVGTCLPKNYFALSVRQIAVSLADAAVNSAISDLAGQIGLSVPTVDPGTTTTTTTATTDPNATP